MKLNKIFMAIAAMAIVGCSSDDLSVSAPGQQAAEDSRLIELDPNFVIAGVGVENTGTRTHWEQDAETGALVNKFLPIWATAPGGGTVDTYADLEKLAVGLCWLGETPGAEVYTNYQFFHYGWLNNGESEADVDKCGTLYNGAMYDEITATSGTAGAEAKPETDWAVAGLPAKSVKGGEDNLNYNSGVYKTENKTIFGGQYIVYYPYNPDFQETGTIPASAETTFNWNIASYPTKPWQKPFLGEATFRYSDPITIDGGFQAADFGLKNLSTLVRLRVFTATAADAYNGSQIDKVVLYSPSEKFVKQAKLGADKIAAKKEGQELYAEKEGTKTVTTNFTTTIPLLDVKKSTEVSAYLTVLPTTVDDLVALVHNKSNSFWYRVELGKTEFKAGGAQVVDITVKEADITSDYIAVDAASLKTALTEAEVEASSSNPITISVIGDITLTSDVTIDKAADRYITIDGGDIIVPQGVTLTVETLKEMKSKVRVLGAECCNTTPIPGGIFVVTGSVADKDATILHNVTLEKTEARYANATEYNNLNPSLYYMGAAPITIADDAKVNVEGGNVYVNREVAHKGAFVNGENKAKDVLFGAKVTVNNGGNLKFMGDASTVENNGIIEVKAGGLYNMTDANNNSTYKEGLRMTNNGKFIHNVDAGVGTAVQYMDQKGEYRCKVNSQVKLDNAYKQWTACNVIEILQSGDYNLGTAADIEKNATAKTDAYKHNNDFIDIEITEGAAVKFKNPGKDKKDIQVGDLTVTSGSLDIIYADDDDADKQRTLTVNGDMTVNANTTITSSRKISVTQDLTIKEATFKYVGGRYAAGKPLKNKELAVTGDITVIGDGINSYAAIFDASDVDALNIKSKNFYLEEKANAIFGNQTSGGDKNLEVKGTISNPKGCFFDIRPAGTGVIAWVSCTNLVSGGLYNAAEPLVVAP